MNVDFSAQCLNAAVYSTLSSLILKCSLKINEWGWAVLGEDEWMTTLGGRCKHRLMDPAVGVVIMHIQSVTNEQQSPLIQGTAVHMKESSS